MIGAGLGKIPYSNILYYLGFMVLGKFRAGVKS